MKSHFLYRAPFITFLGLAMALRVLVLLLWKYQNRVLGLLKRLLPPKKA